MNFKNIKSNQIILFVVALMLVSAGYLSYSMRGTPVSSNIVSENEVSSIGDARLVSSNNVIDSNSLNEVSVATSSSSSSRTDDYFASSRLGRDTMYSQMIESYQKILESDNVTTEQKNIAQQEISKINELKNSIMIAENLIKTKGFEDLIIFVNNKSVNIIVKAGELKPEQIAQIQNVTNRELGVEIENIHISNKN